MAPRKKRKSPSRIPLRISTTPQIVQALEILRQRSGTKLTNAELATLLVAKRARKELKEMRSWGKKK